MTPILKRLAPETRPYDLVVIGAGIAGLNALFVATQYLGPGSRVALIDRRDSAGGVWTDVYEHCRLHQPHPAFTVGDLRWRWRKPARYLATGAEVERHLRDCLARTAPRVDLRPLFGHELIGCEEIVTPDGPLARVAYRPAGSHAAPRTIEARRVIKATGFDVTMLEPLKLTSRDVISTTPQDLMNVADGIAPVFVIGGGKTGMDAALAMIQRSRSWIVNLVNGKGTVFLRRETLFPHGPRRWFGGTMVADFFRDIALRFDGSNEDQVFNHTRRRYAISLPGSSERFFYGVLSEAERDEISCGIQEIYNDYLQDVIDGPEGPVMIMRGGSRIEVPKGSVFVNCTGHLLRRGHPYEPYLSQQGTVLTVGPRSMVHFLSSMSAYFLTHLFFRGQLRDLPLYEFDGEAIRTHSPRLYHTALMALTYINQLVIVQALPLRIVMRCGLDIDRLYPLHRRALALVGVKLNGARDIRHCREALDRMRRRTGVRCGPLIRPVRPAKHVLEQRPAA